MNKKISLLGVCFAIVFIQMLGKLLFQSNCEIPIFVTEMWEMGNGVKSLHSTLSF